MKKLFLALIALIVILCVLGAIAWTRRASIAAQLIQRKVDVPVSIGSLDFHANGAQINDYQMGNPRGFRSPNSFTANQIAITATLQELKADPLTIEEIDMSDLLVTLESKRDGSTNWDEITAPPSRKPGEKSRHYLIKVLVLRNLTVQAIKPDGSKKVYPTIPQMVFYNISDETGFPVSEIEKAIFNLMMKDLFRQLDLKNQLLPLIPGGKTILPFLP
jgi:uncharacterized protein involved in outer membrane biogenesis